MVLINMFWKHGNVDGCVIDLLKEIELAGDFKLFVSFREMNNDNKIVTKMAKLLFRENLRRRL